MYFFAIEIRKEMKKILLAFVLFLFSIIHLSAQYITNGQDTLLGNEWINFNQSYYKINIAQDGVYRLNSQALITAGIDLSAINGQQFQMWHNGEQVAIYVTTEGYFNSWDYLEFFGMKNKSELDRFLFQNPDSMMMNPLYSLVTDTAAYFLTWTGVGNINKRYTSTPNNVSNAPAKEDYYYAEMVTVLTNTARKKADSEGISVSNYDMAEGFAADYSASKTYSFAPTNIYTSVQESYLSIRLTGNLGQHAHQFYINDNLLFTSNYFNNEVQNPSMTFPSGYLTNNTKVKIVAAGPNADKHRVGNIVLKYPRLFNFNNQAYFQFDIDASSESKYFEISNFNVTNGQVVLYDITNELRIECLIENGLVKVVVPPSTQKRTFTLLNADMGYIEINSIKSTEFFNFNNLDNDFIILTSKELMDDGAGNNPIQDYANYRSSADGGSYNPIIVQVEQLYDQFSWGVDRHPFGVRNFGLFVKKYWLNPKYIFIIGKGREYRHLRTEANLQDAKESGFYVPTYSFPGSDNLLFAGPDGFTPVLPIGRIAATAREEIRIYLDKVKEFEGVKSSSQTINDRLWMKNVLHLGGGATSSEQSTIRSALSNMENILTSSSYGSSVKNYYKTSTDPIQVSQTQQIFDYINNGTSFITFFGHSSTGTFDFSIDNPDNFLNKGKYPMILSLGCHSGNIHSATPGLSERFCFFKDKGSIAFGATSGLGFISSLSVFSSKFYQKLGNEFYGKGVGDAIQATISESISNFGIDLIKQQFNLHGDPSLKIYTFEGPDYLVDEASIKLEPEHIHAQLSSFEIKFDVVNIGKAVSDSMLIRIERELPDGTRLLVTEMMVETPTNRSTQIVQIPTLGKLAHGFNKIFVTVDSGNKIDELPNPSAEQNNELVVGGSQGLLFHVGDNSVFCAYPPNFAILGNSTISLTASTSEPLTPERNYIFQIDTTELFNSPVLETSKLTHSGGVLKWTPNVNWKDEQVYYWRISADSLSPQEGFTWDNSSFLYLSNSLGGWNQSHYYQWKKDIFNEMELKQHGHLKFIDNFKDVFIKNAVNSVDNIDLQINNGYVGRWFPTPSGMYVIVLDSTSSKQWINYQPSQYGLNNPNNFDMALYMFSTQTTDTRQQLIDFLQNVVPSNNYVLVFTTQGTLGDDFKPQEWESDTTLLGTDLFKVLESQGATLIRNTINLGSLPYVFAYKKDVGPIVEELADSLTEVLRVNFSLPGYWDRGDIISTPIGPAKTWDKLIWEIEPSANSQTDTFSVDIMGYDPTTLKDTVLMNDLQPGEYDLSAISTDSFSYLRLKFNSEDSILRTSAQIKHWRLLYQGVPDFAVNPNGGGYVFESDTLQRGKPFQFKCLVENLSNFAGDSLLVRYMLRNDLNFDTTIFRKEPMMEAHDTFISNLHLASENLSGKYDFTFELNPIGHGEQLETTRNNNVLTTNFLVANDLKNPLLDVTFDGNHILNGDLVSATPIIRVSLEDENQYLLLNDTSSILLYFVYPDSEGVLKRVYFNEPILTFHPADNSSSNKATLELKPHFIQDGDYKLIVQARDVTGNQSGLFDHKVTFKVVTKSSISSFLNYPNPFTTSTRFVYTMTGSVPPERYKLQIMTVSGRVVREIGEEELGKLKVGTHQTDYTWDGTDEYGDRLAKGVYLYRVLVQDEKGKEWEKYETGADEFNKNGFGKMVLLR